jgi:hypothetical protein
MSVELLKLAHDGSAQGFLAAFSAHADDPAVINAANPDGRTALHYWCLSDGKGAMACVQAIVSCEGTNLNLCDGQGQAPLHLALKEAKTAPIARLLLRSGCDVTLSDSFGRLPLHWCAQHGHADLAMLCLSGVDVNTKTTSGDTALHWAVGGAHASIVRLLVNNKADVGIQNGRDETAGQWMQRWSASVGQEKRVMVESLLTAAQQQQSSDTHSAATQPTSVATTNTIPMLTPGSKISGLKRKKPAVKKKMKIKLKAKAK